MLFILTYVVASGSSGLAYILLAYVVIISQVSGFY